MVPALRSWLGKMSAYCAGFWRFLTPGLAAMADQAGPALLPTVGPSPAAPPAKLPPVPAGIEKQLVQARVPALAEKPRLLRIGSVVVPPIERMPGIAEPIGVASL